MTLLNIYNENHKFIRLFFLIITVPYYESKQYFNE
jgi:hypothetical protein